MKNFNLVEVLKSLKAVSKIDEGLDELVFGHSLGFLGEKATDEDKEKLERVVSVVGNLLSNLRDEDEEECEFNKTDQDNNLQKEIDNEKIEDEPCQTEGNVLENHHKKLTLPELMKSQKLRYKPIISNIRLINSKEFSTNYCPYPSFMKTGDCIRTNVYGAKFCH